MNIKLILYCLTIPFSVWIITSTNLDKFFRKNKLAQIHSAYVVLSIILSYLIVNTLMDLHQTIINLL